MADMSGKDLAYRAVASVFGGPVDLTTMVMRPFGYNVEKPVLGSEWVGQKMEQSGLVSNARDPLKEFAASIMIPSPGGLAAGLGKGAALLPAIAGMTKSGKVGDALKGVVKALPETIPPGAQDALEEYIAGTATHWNTLLRSAVPLEKFESKSQRLIGDLDSYLASGYQAKGETLWRATANEQADELAKLKVGNLFNDKGFMSTSRSKDAVINRIAPEMEDFGGNVHILQIKLPNGQVIRGKDVVGPTDHFAWQKEFLLGRGHQFKVIGKTEENGFPVTILELQPK